MHEIRIAVRSPVGWTPLTDTTDRDKRTNERANDRTVGQTDEETRLRPSVRLLDGV